MSSKSNQRKANTFKGRLIKSLDCDFKFDLPPRNGSIVLHKNLFSYPKGPLDQNVLLALTLNEACGKLRRGMFFWLPTIASTSAQVRGLRELQRAEAEKLKVGDTGREATAAEKSDGSSKEDVANTANASSAHILSHADLLFEADYEWTEAEYTYWRSIDARMKRSVSQAQLNPLQKCSAVVLPVYVDIISASKWDINAGPRLAAHNGALLVYQSVIEAECVESNDYGCYRAFIDSLFSFRYNDGRSSGGQGAVFKRAIYGRGSSNRGLLLQWAEAWLESHEVRPASNSAVVLELQRLARSKIQLLERWEDALDRAMID